MSPTTSLSRSPSTADGLAPVHLPVHRERLDCGLRIVVHPDHTVPLVSVLAMIHAGSGREPPGRTGLAHLVEHLFFEGTEHCPKGEADRLLEGVGGSGNGSTWWDRTAYYETVPRNAVELALWLERERLLHTLPVLDDHTLEIQRQVVLNERRQMCENRPYGLAEERLQELVFPPGHPYHHPTIGYPGDIAGIGMEDVRRFTTRWYRADRIVVVVAGALDPGPAVDLVERFLGDLPAGGPEGPGPAARENGRAGGRSTMTDRVTFPRLHLAWATPPFGSGEWICLDVLAYLLAAGEGALLPRRLLRERGLAQDVDARLYPTELAGYLEITATARSGIEPERIESEIRQILASVANGEISERDVRGAVRRARADQLGELAPLGARAESLGFAELTLGNAARLADTIDAYARIDRPALMQAAAGLRPEAGATLTVLPAGGGHG